jgi:hypothetical protein
MITAQRFPAALIVIFVHFVIGMLLVFGFGVPGMHTTPLSLLSTVAEFNSEVVGGVLIATAMLAALPFAMIVDRQVFVFCIAPQQILLVLHSTSVMLAITAGHYPDGYVPAGGSYFILIDQIWLLAIALWHTFEYAQM